MIRVVAAPFLAPWSSGDPPGDQNFSNGDRLYVADSAQPSMVEFVREDDCFKKYAANYTIAREVLMARTRKDPCPHLNSKPVFDQRTDVDWRHCDDCGMDYQIDLGLDST